MGEESSVNSSTTVIDSSNIGFKLLKKHGWKEGTGLGVYEQGRLEPVESQYKNNKRGLGADVVKKKFIKKPPQSSASINTDDKTSTSKKSKQLSRKQKKMQELEKQLQEKEFERAFFREFWPDNV